MWQMCHTKVVDIFTPLEVKRQFPTAIERTYEAGQIIFYHGDAPNHIVCVVSGAVKFYDTDSEGNEKIMHISGKGGVFPLFYSFEEKDSIDAFYQTITTTKVLLIPLDIFQNKLKTQPGFAAEVLQSYAEEVDLILTRLKGIEKSTAKQKVAQALHFLGTRHTEPLQKSPQWLRIVFPVTQQLLADLTGLSRETVNVTLKDPDILRALRIRRQTFDVQPQKLTDIFK